MGYTAISRVSIRLALKMNKFRSLERSTIKFEIYPERDDSVGHLLASVHQLLIHVL